MSDYTPTTEEVARLYWTGKRRGDWGHPTKQRNAAEVAGRAEFDRWLARVTAEAAADALEQTAEIADLEVAWTESNFLRGPNTDYAVRHNREMAEELRERAAAIRADDAGREETR